MPPLSRRPASGAAFAAILSGCCLAAATPAAAFKVVDSPGAKGCAVWANDDGQPLQTKAGGKIGRKVPCGEVQHNDEAFETLFGEAPGTLVIRDEKRKLECLAELAPGSKTVVVFKACQPWAGG